MTHRRPKVTEAEFRRAVRRLRQNARRLHDWRVDARASVGRMLDACAVIADFLMADRRRRMRLHRMALAALTEMAASGIDDAMRREVPQ